MPGTGLPRSAGARQQAEVCVCFSLQSFPAPRESRQHEAREGKKCELTLLSPLLTPEQEGLFLLVLF